jgi:hypothetical protein
MTFDLTNCDRLRFAVNSMETNDVLSHLNPSEVKELENRFENLQIELDGVKTTFNETQKWMIKHKGDCSFSDLVKSHTLYKCFLKSCRQLGKCVWYDDIYVTLEMLGDGPERRKRSIPDAYVRLLMAW